MTHEDKQTPPADAGRFDRVRPLAWRGVGCISHTHVYAEDDEPRSDACGPWVPLYGQDQLDSVIRDEAAAMALVWQHEAVIESLRALLKRERETNALMQGVLRQFVDQSLQYVDGLTTLTVSRGVVLAGGTS